MWPQCSPGISRFVFGSDCGFHLFLFPPYTQLYDCTNKTMDKSKQQPVLHKIMILAIVKCHYDTVTPNCYQSEALHSWSHYYMWLCYIGWWHVLLKSFCNNNLVPLWDEIDCGKVITMWVRGPVHWWKPTWPVSSTVCTSKQRSVQVKHILIKTDYRRPWKSCRCSKQEFQEEGLAYVSTPKG